MISEVDHVHRGIKRMSWRRWLPTIGPEKGRILVGLIRRNNPKRVLEVGTLIGYSAILMGRELGPDAEFITIEIDEDEAEEARENIAKAGIKAEMEVLVGDALRVIPTLKGQFDFIFLDAEKDEYIDYLRLVEPKIHKGTVVVADNAGASAWAMRDYLDYVRNSGRYQSRFIKVGWDGMEVSTKL